MTTKDETGFLSRWSRRKQAVANGEDIERDDPTPLPLDESARAAQAEAEEARLAELEANRLAAEAIDLETLDYHSDYSAFLKDGVPTLLRQNALRMLWRSNPVLANVDGLCDYDENFADPSLILDKFESAYKIGKGYLFDDDEAESEQDDEAVSVSEELPQTTDSAVENADDPPSADHADDAQEQPEDAEAEADGQTTLATSDHQNAPKEERTMPPRISLRTRLSLEDHMSE